MTTKVRFHRAETYTSLGLLIPLPAHVDTSTFCDSVEVTIFDPSRELLLALKAAVEKALE